MRLVSSTLLDLVIVLINRNTAQTRALAKGIAGLFTSAQVRESTDQSLITFYLSLVSQIIAEEIDKTTPDLLLAVLIKFEGSDVFDEHPEMRQQIKTLLMSSDPTPDRIIDRKIRMFRTMLEQANARAYARSLYRKFQEIDDIADEDEQLSRAEELTRLIKEGVPSDEKYAGEEDFAPAERISTDDPQSLEDALMTYSERNTDTAIIRTGLKGLNKAFGPIGGIPMGRSVCFIAKANNYKSSMLRSMLCWTILYHTPPEVTPDDPRRPMLYLNSVENGSHEDIVWIYRKLYFHQHKREPLIDVKSKEWIKQVTKWIVDFAAAKGWVLLMERYLPSAMTSDRLCRRVEVLQKTYRVVLVVMDYLGNCATSQGLQRDQQMRELYSVVCNWMKNEGITFITAHQTNTKFSEETQAKANKVKYGNDRHIKDGPDALREVDLLFFILKEENNFGKEFLTIYKLKDRYRDDTPLTDRYLAYEFVQPGIGGIPDDLEEESVTYVRDINDVKEDGFDTAHGTPANAFDF